MLGYIFRARAKLHIAKPHVFTFLVDEPLKDEDGNVLSPSQTVHTITHLVRNAGKETATNVELVFNWKPLCINIWPSRHFKEHTEKDNRYILVFDSLAPGELIGVELLSINRELPHLVNVRSDQCTATTIEMYPQPFYPAWKRRLAAFLLLAGLAFVAYVSVVLLQFLIESP
jgi:hypothetical protein